MNLVTPTEKNFGTALKAWRIFRQMSMAKFGKSVMGSDTEASAEHWANFAERGNMTFKMGDLREMSKCLQVNLSNIFQVAEAVCEQFGKDRVDVLYYSEEQIEGLGHPAWLIPMRNYVMIRANGDVSIEKFENVVWNQEHLSKGNEIVVVIGVRRTREQYYGRNK